MEELLCHGYQYTFILPNKTFTAIFDRIEAPYNTLFVTDYADENGKVPGTRSMPLSWVKQVELLSESTQCDVETMELTTIPIVKKRNKKTKNKTPEFVNNFTF